MYDIRVNTKGDLYGDVKRVIARTPEEGKYTALIIAMEEVNNNKFVYDYENNGTINTENITAIYLVGEDPARDIIGCGFGEIRELDPELENLISTFIGKMEEALEKIGDD